MSAGVAVVLDGVDYGQRLPRGRHGIPHELVAANQRERLLNATATVIAEQGYASLAVSDLTARAGVSRATFYKLFDDKHDCVLVAQGWAVEHLLAAITAAGGDEWPKAVAAGVGAALKFATDFPGQARLVLASSRSPSEPKLARDGLALHLRLVDILHRGSQRFAGTRSPSGLTEQAAVGAALSIVENCLAGSETGALSSLREDIVEIILTPYLGADWARRVAGAEQS